MIKIDFCIFSLWWNFLCNISSFQWLKLFNRVIWMTFFKKIFRCSGLIFTSMYKTGEAALSDFKEYFDFSAFHLLVTFWLTDYHPLGGGGLATCTFNNCFTKMIVCWCKDIFTVIMLEINYNFEIIFGINLVGNKGIVRNRL